MIINHIGMKLLQIFEKTVDFHYDVAKVLGERIKEEVKDEVDMINKN